MHEPKEIALQTSVASALRRWARPDWRWTHFPAGEARDARTGAKLKQMGLQPGWPDLVLLSPSQDGRSSKVHFIELKRRGGKLSEEQEAFATWCQENGIEHAVADTIDGALAVLCRWGVLRMAIRP